MKDGVRIGDQVEVSRRGLHEDYVNCYHRGAEVQPCRDPCLLKTAAQYLLRETEPRETFTVFPFYQVLSEGLCDPSTDCRRLLSAFIKAVELLEIICVNLFLQPWKKEIKTLKTFTGPFVYCLLPVFSRSTIQSVLASIGYLPHTDTPLSEYRLSEDANLDRAMLVGFELLLARVKCNHLLERLDKDQLGPQEWLELLQRRAGSTKTEEPTEMKITMGKKEEEVEEKLKEEADRKEMLSCLDTRLAVNPQPKPRSHHLISVDQSLMEMQMTYPDLAIRGRPLLPDKPQRAHSTRSSNKAVHTTSDESRAADLSARDYIRDTKTAAATTISCRNYVSKGAEVLGEGGRGSGCNDNNSGRTTAPGNATSSCAGNTDTSRVEDELSHPQAMSLHITLRTGSTLGQRLKPGEPQPTAEPPAWTQQQTTADLLNKTLANPELSSVSSTDEEQELRELAERMGQLYVHDGKEELKRKGENMRGDENANKGRRKKERRTSSEREAEEQNLRRPVLETGTGLSQAATRSTKSSQSDTSAMKEHELSPQSARRTQCQRCKGGSTEHQEGADTETDQREEEQLAQSYVIVEHHKK